MRRIPIVHLPIALTLAMALACGTGANSSSGKSEGEIAFLGSDSAVLESDSGNSIDQLWETSGHEATEATAQDSCQNCDASSDLTSPDLAIPDVKPEESTTEDSKPEDYQHNDAADSSPDVQPEDAFDTSLPDVTPDLVEDTGPVCFDDDPLHCGPSCLVCQGATPHCHQGMCTICNADNTCGPSCTPCQEPTPVCRPDGVACVQCLFDSHCPGAYCGPSATCVQCITNDHCPGDELCDPATYSCVPEAPTLGCDDNLSPNGYTCSKAKIIGRRSVAGVQKSFFGYLLSSQANDDDAGSCDDNGDEEFYRIYLGQGQLLELELSVSGPYDPAIKIYSGTDCDNNGTSDLLVCHDAKSDSSAETYAFTAPLEGWYSIIADGKFTSGYYEDSANFMMKIKAICTPSHCGCP